MLFACLLILINLVAVLQDNHSKNSIVHPATIAGPWECVAQDGIHGVFIQLQGAGPSPISGIRVYGRQNGNEEGEYFVPGKPFADSVELDDRHLDIRFTGLGYPNAFSISLTFDTAAQQWTGRWSACSETGQAVLTRPHVQGGNENPIVGDWKGKPNPNGRPWFTPGSLHVRQSSDGLLIVWMDRALDNGRYGEQLKIVSAGPSVVELQTTFGFGATYTYTAALSQDGKRLSGFWHVGNSHGMSLQAPDYFEREQVPN